MEHHSPFCRSNEHRFLSMKNRRGQVACPEMAGSVQGKHPLRVHPERRLFRDDDDQFHHERCRDRHFPAGGSGTGTLPERGSGSDPFRIVGGGGNALSTAGRSSPQRDRL